MAYEIAFNVTDFERALGELIGRLEHRQPLMKKLAHSMWDAVEENFAQQGRPAWMGWSPKYARRRGPGQILQLSGRLASSVMPYSDNDSATVGTNVAYAAIHNFGGVINIPARSQQAYYRVSKSGERDNRFSKKSKANYSEWHTIPAYQIKMPRREFLRLNESDVAEMEKVAENYFSQIYR
ncbi:phage virion morphogenesis protein [Pantoea ananatis]|uniref:phage virion morphogenesis protein n=1 Tax=Pantoea ananas TaxID=553 RepID=UPI003CE93EFD